jgi:DNA replicative helicase MCM subunit Mcm2 (Cdc46/Mcm family)
VKLSLLLTLIGGSETQSDRGVRRRSQSHLLICGDPGCGKVRRMANAKYLLPVTYTSTFGATHHMVNVGV